MKSHRVILLYFRSRVTPDWKGCVNEVQYRDPTLGDTVHVLQRIYGGPEGEEGDQVHQGLELVQIQDALLHLGQRHADLFELLDAEERVARRVLEEHVQLRLQKRKENQGRWLSHTCSESSSLQMRRFAGPSATQIFKRDLPT